MDQEMIKKIGEVTEKLDALQKMVAQMRKYFLWTMIISVAVIVLPMIGLVFVVPQFLNTYQQSIGDGGVLDTDIWRTR